MRLSKARFCKNVFMQRTIVRQHSSSNFVARWLCISVLFRVSHATRLYYHALEPLSTLFLIFLNFFRRKFFNSLGGISYYHSFPVLASLFFNFFYFFTDPRFFHISPPFSTYNSSTSKSFGTKRLPLKYSFPSL